MFGAEDLRQIGKLGMEPGVLMKQLRHFREGFPFINLERPAIPGDGILSFSEQQASELIRLFEQNQPSLRLMKFVPASGAASRMFRQLFEFREQYSSSGDCFDELFFDKGFDSVHAFFSNLERFAFYRDLEACMHNDNLDPITVRERKEYDQIIGYLLDPRGLNYSNLPKAMLKFHDYPEGARTAAEEHLVEAFHYCRDSNGTARIHFTLSPEHVDKFMEMAGRVKGIFEDLYNAKFELSWSVQKPSTDTIAADEENEPFRNEDGTLLFRPGGHGALLPNLQALDADMIFIKNIDNIVPDRLKEPTYRYKKLAAGYAYWIRERIHQFLKESESGNIEPGDIDAVAAFAKDHCMLGLPAGFDRMLPAEKRELLRKLLNRPIRVCGMVKNVGEPGGGPYWVKGSDGSISLQIVESSQVDHRNSHQEKIFASATHFNPVDLVCCTNDYTGKRFNLEDWVDESTGLISQKSSGGRKLKAQELPGLWNGSMAGWLTVFIEVPLITFNPVKTVNDLLREEHQSIINR